MKNKIAFVTGSAGFVGFHLTKNLLEKKWIVIGFDGLTDYYDVQLKLDREKILKNFKNYTSYHGMLEDKKLLLKLLKIHDPSHVFHMAAQAGVRHSLTNPKIYIDSNLVGTFNLLDACKEVKLQHLLIASTSSVYGSNSNLPFKEIDKSDHQISFYAATKKSTEMMAHSYSYTYNLPTTIIRFFTVYGPWGRPDMALFKFTNSILNNKVIKIYNHGDMKRDFTYIDDLIKGIILLSNKIPTINKALNQIGFDSLSSSAPYRIVNIGNSNPIQLLDYVNELEEQLNLKANKEFVEMQTGDVKETYSNVDLLKELTNFKPNTNIKIGIKNFVKWYKNYYRINS